MVKQGRRWGVWGVTQVKHNLHCLRTRSHTPIKQLIHVEYTHLQRVSSLRCPLLLRNQQRGNALLAGAAAQVLLLATGRGTLENINKTHSLGLLQVLLRYSRNTTLEVLLVLTKGAQATILEGAPTVYSCSTATPSKTLPTAGRKNGTGCRWSRGTAHTHRHSTRDQRWDTHALIDCFPSFLCYEQNYNKKQTTTLFYTYKIYTPPPNKKKYPMGPLTCLNIAHTRKLSTRHIKKGKVHNDKHLLQNIARRCHTSTKGTGLLLLQRAETQVHRVKSERTGAVDDTLVTENVVRCAEIVTAATVSLPPQPLLPLSNSAAAVRRSPLQAA